MIKGGNKLKKRILLIKDRFFITGLLLMLFLLSLNFLIELFGNHSINPYLIVSLLIVVSSLAYCFLSKSQVKSKKNNLSSSKSGSMKTLINNLSSGIIEVNHLGQIELYNAGCLSILDTNKTLLNLDINQVLKVETLEGKEIDIKQKILSTKRMTTTDKLIYHYKNGEKIRLEMIISPIKNNFGVNEENSFLLIMRDVTKVKDLEQQKDEFISVISHELRTPITIVEGVLSNLELLSDREKIDQKKFKRLLNKSHQQIMFLSSMVNDLANLRRAQSKQIIEVEKINTRQFIEQIYEIYLPQVEQKQLSFDLDLKGRLGYITTNELYLKEIIQNLLTNAIKYTKEGQIKLSVERNNLNTIIEVKDSGIGISKNEQARVFEKFYRSEDYRTRENNGTGLGLYVAQGLANRLGGEIKLKSRINFGSTFTLTIPNKR